MSETETLPAAPTTKSPVPIGTRGIVLADIDGLWRFSSAVSKSGLAPKGIQSPEGIFVAIQMGLEVGLTPMAALQNIAVINGRPSIWGDAQLAIVRGTGELEAFEEWFEARGTKLPRNPTSYTDDTTAVCRVKRRGYPPTEVGFSVQDAKTAGLWAKEGPWRQYPFRMLRSRARSFALRDTFGDALKGILSGEEAQDTPYIDVTTTTVPASEAAPADPPRFSRAAKEARRGEKPAEVPAGGSGGAPAVNPTISQTPHSQTEPPSNPGTANGANSEPANPPGGVAQPAPAAPPAAVSVQDQLAGIIGAARYTFDQFMQVCLKLTDVPEADKLAPGFSDLSETFSRRMVSSKAGLLRALKGEFGEGGAK